MGRNEPGNIAWVEAAWIRWVVLSAALAFWAVIVYLYPVYFQRDDFSELFWARNHSFVECFIPTRDAALFHDGMYRPLRELLFIVQYRLFGLNSHIWHFLLGATFIFSFALFFKLIARVGGYLAGYLAILMWLVPFQFLLTNLFWLSDIHPAVEMLLACGGLYCFVSGFGCSPFKVVGGVILMSTSLLAKETVIVILPVTLSVFLVTAGRAVQKWRPMKTAIYALLPLLAVPIYFAALPAVAHRRVGTTLSDISVLIEIWNRLQYYGQSISSGSGILLIVPAVYYILRSSFKRQNNNGRVFPLTFLASVVLSLLLGSADLWLIALLVLLGAGLRLPRRMWFLVAWGFFPLFGLCLFEQVVRTYLYETSFGLSALAAVLASYMLRDTVSYWRERVSRALVTYGALAVIVLVVVGLGTIKFQRRCELLRIRSEVTMNTRRIMPYLKRIESGSVLVVVDYESMGVVVSKQALHWTDREKLLHLNPVTFMGTEGVRRCLSVHDRPDVQVVDFATFRKNGPQPGASNKVYLWVTTWKEHEFVTSQNLHGRIYASVGHGLTRMYLLQLNAE